MAKMAAISTTMRIERLTFNSSIPRERGTHEITSVPLRIQEESSGSNFSTRHGFYLISQPLVFSEGGGIPLRSVDRFFDGPFALLP
jgi:hypothetical protein